jgi:hypothetical protein
MVKRSKFSELMKGLSFSDDGKILGDNPLEVKKSRKVKEKKIVFSRVVHKSGPKSNPDELAYEEAKKSWVDPNKNGGRKIKPFKQKEGEVLIRITDKMSVYGLPENADAIRAKYNEKANPEPEFKGVRPKKNKDNSYAKETADTYTK